jgi:hypothetical protein
VSSMESIPNLISCLDSLIKEFPKFLNQKAWMPSRMTAAKMQQSEP